MLRGILINISSHNVLNIGHISGIIGKAICLLMERGFWCEWWNFPGICRPINFHKVFKLEHSSRLINDFIRIQYPPSIIYSCKPRKLLNKIINSISWLSPRYFESSRHSYNKTSRRFFIPPMHCAIFMQMNSSSMYKMRFFQVTAKNVLVKGS